MGGEDNTGCRASSKYQGSCGLRKKKDQRYVADLFVDPSTARDNYYYRVASYLNAHREELPLFFEKADCLEVFARIIGLLKPDVRALAVRIASRLIVKIARQVADTGYRSGQWKKVRNLADSTEIDFDSTLESYAEQPDRGIAQNIVSYARCKEKSAFIMMIDHSYSMKGIKVILAAITAAAVSYHFRTDYAVLAFHNEVSYLKSINSSMGPEVILDRLFNLELKGDTDVRLVLQKGLQEISRFERKVGLLLTDGAWNRGGDPLSIAVMYDKLNVIGFPPAKPDKICQLAVKGKGTFCFVSNEAEIASAIIKCLN